MTRILSRTAGVAVVFATLLAGCGGDGGAPAETPSETIGPLFLSDGDTGTVAAFPTLTTGGGLAFGDHVVATLAAVVSDPPLPALEPLAYDAVRDELYVGGFQNRMMAVSVFSGAAGMTAGAHPARVISFVGDGELSQLAVDPASDTLTMVGPQGEAVGPAIAQLAAMSPASTASGVVARTLGVPVPAWPFQATVAADPGRDMLYATWLYANASGSGPSTGVALYAHASSGLVTPDRTLLPAVAPASISVGTARDILYAADPVAGLWIVLHASTASPSVVGPLPMTGATLVATDAGHDRLYVVASQNLLVFAHASALTSTSRVPAPTVTNSGAISGIAFR